MAAEALYGEVGFRGRLPVTVHASASKGDGTPAQAQSLAFGAGLQTHARRAQKPQIPKDAQAQLDWTRDRVRSEVEVEGAPICTPPQNEQQQQQQLDLENTKQEHAHVQTKAHEEL